MLVLSRQPNETVRIGDDVEITIVEIRGNKVRLGITAAPHVPIQRTEIADRIRDERSQFDEFAERNPTCIDE